MRRFLESVSREKYSTLQKFEWVRTVLERVMLTVGDFLFSGFLVFLYIFSHNQACFEEKTEEDQNNYHYLSSKVIKTGHNVPKPKS